MAKQLNQAITNQINAKRLGVSFIFKINGTVFTDYIMGWSLDFSKEFGSASAQFQLDNNYGYFNDGEIYGVSVGDVVEFIEKYQNDTTEFKRFYGIVNQRRCRYSWYYFGVFRLYFYSSNS